jgi:hypothetical protein
MRSERRLSVGIRDHRPRSSPSAEEKMNVGSEADTIHSSYRERLIEHLFVGEVLRTLWIARVSQVEVLRSEVDGAGYDIVLECQSLVRHIQLKAARREGKRASVGVQLRLREKPSGCVIWIYFKPETMELGPFFWFGGLPGQPLPDIVGFKVGKHTKGDSKGRKSARPNIRLVPKGRFDRVDSVEGIVDRLFGEPTTRLLGKPPDGAVQRTAPARAPARRH